MATVEENEQISRRLTERVFGERDFDLINELVAEDYVLHDPDMPEPVHGREGYREMAEEGTSMIDGSIEIDHTISMDDWVVSRWTQRGTHIREMMGIEPTNEEVTVTGIDISRFEDGKLAETWHEVNILGMLMQIGALPENFSPTE